MAEASSVPKGQPFAWLKCGLVLLALLKDEALVLATAKC